MPLKKIVFLIFFGITLLIPSLAISAIESVPTEGTNTAECSTSTITSVASPCVTTPEYYRIWIYEMGFCNNVAGMNADTGRSSSSLYWRDNCVKTYDAGGTPTELIIENNISSGIIESNIVNPPNGSYTHGYVLLDNRLDIKTYKSFQLGEAGDIEGARTGGGGVADDSSAAVVCWTTSAGIYCDSSINMATYDWYNITFGNLGDTGNCDGATNFHCSYNTSADYADGLNPTHAFMLDSSLVLEEDTIADVDYLLGMESFTSVKVKSNNTIAYVVNFKVSRGATIIECTDCTPTVPGNTVINIYPIEFKVVTTVTNASNK